MKVPKSNGFGHSSIYVSSLKMFSDILDTAWDLRKAWSTTVINNRAETVKDKQHYHKTLWKYLKLWQTFHPVNVFLSSTDNRKYSGNILNSFEIVICNLQCFLALCAPDIICHFDQDWVVHWH